MSGFWDQRFAEPGYKYGIRPNAWLQQQAHRLAPGSTVLLPGDGEGRNSVWLARQGHGVTAMDSSAVGLAKAQALATEAGVRLQTVQADLAGRAVVMPASARGGSMQAMADASQTIPIHNAEAPAHAGCGACLSGAAGGPVCSTVIGDACAAPELCGPADELQHLMQALAPVLGFSDNTGQRAGAGLVRALHVAPGEVVLTLAVGRHCGGAALADSAFQTLRGLLPDTDIYVTLAG